MLGKELRDYRKEHGYLQKEIAETLGISASLLSRIERGKREVTVEEERKILELFPELAKEKLHGKYTVYTDGGCGFNPGGPGGIGAVILDAEGKVIQEIEGVPCHHQQPDGAPGSHRGPQGHSRRSGS